MRAFSELDHLVGTRNVKTDMETINGYIRDSHEKLRPFTVAWDRHSAFPVWTYADNPQWHEDEGNNP